MNITEEHAYLIMNLMHGVNYPFDNCPVLRFQTTRESQKFITDFLNQLEETFPHVVGQYTKLMSNFRDLENV